MLISLSVRASVFVKSFESSDILFLRFVCSGIDKQGLMFEREYTAVLLDRHEGKSSRELSLAKMDAKLMKSQKLGSQNLSLRQLEDMVNSSRSLEDTSVPLKGENNENDEIYDFVISLIPRGG